jgi:hypothetical protein
VLLQRVRRLEAAGLLGEQTAAEAALQYQAMCEGLVAVERRGMHKRIDGEQLWRGALRSLVTGFRVAPGSPAMAPR